MDNPGLHTITLTLDESERPATVHELARILLSWTDGPLPSSAGESLMGSATYNEALVVFRDLCEDTIHEGFTNEYVRGGVNLLADLFAVVEMDAGERMEQVLADLRRIPMFADPANLSTHGVATYVHDPNEVN